MRKNQRTKYIGIYCILNKKEDRKYIGASVDMTGRFTHHRFTLRRGIHKTAALQEAWNRDGEDNFVFLVLEKCEKKCLK